MVVSNLSKNENVYGFIERIVKEKYGNQMDQDFYNSETKRVYQEFDNGIFEYFSGIIPEKEKAKFEESKNNAKEPSQALAFLMDNIDNFEYKILKYLVDFRKNYLLP